MVPLLAAKQRISDLPSSFYAWPRSGVLPTFPLEPIPVSPSVRHPLVICISNDHLSGRELNLITGATNKPPCDRTNASNGSVRRIHLVPYLNIPHKDHSTRRRYLCPNIERLAVPARHLNVDPAESPVAVHIDPSEGCGQDKYLPRFQPHQFAARGRGAFYVRAKFDEPANPSGMFLAEPIPGWRLRQIVKLALARLKHELASRYYTSDNGTRVFVRPIRITHCVGPSNAANGSSSSSCGG